MQSLCLVFGTACSHSYLSCIWTACYPRDLAQPAKEKKSIWSSKTRRSFQNRQNIIELSKSQVVMQVSAGRTVLRKIKNLSHMCDTMTGMYEKPLILVRTRLTNIEIGR